MALQVISTELDPSSTFATVIIQADEQHEVLSADAKKLAIREGAQRGLPRPGISSSGGAYPVDAQGKTADGLSEQTMGQVVGYRIDYKVQGGL